jgi:hypothetical protein
MKLATVISKQFAPAACKLIETYTSFFCEEVVVYVFGEPFDFPCKSASIKHVPMLCEHAHNPRFYFYKTYVIYDMMQQDDDFVYLDACHRFRSYPTDVINKLDSESRFFVSYPIAYGPSWVYPMRRDTTKKCFQLMGADTVAHWKAPAYWAAIQAWKPTQENRAFAEEYLQYMLNPDIAGPSNWIEYPEPNNPLCQHHRNDQSCLSILIHKYGWHQPYTDILWAKYGDYHTIRTVQPTPVIEGRQ